MPGSNDETMVLPVFVTGKKPEPPKTRPSPADSLPPSERGMLIFVAALLALGTLAVVGMMGFGLTGSGKPKPPAGQASATGGPTPSPATPAAVVPPDPSPSPSAAPSPSRTHRSPTPGRSPTPARRLLGTLSIDDLRAYCAPRRPDPDGGQWSCGRTGPDFTPTTVCRFRFGDHGAYAVVGDIRDPSTWRCYT